ncbi:putative ATP-dependent DNA helicase HFM1-like protein [Leptotrombidium deliense]|uniref:DNA 3'-5' helicase n=1 Tax=Leptotrombidium deliense TaxID=299467 RepID=A0A443S7W2_9ACAR|nr:putative ATP-dependent DNA helicase HFM1-like protein [Leptotrombidium deliense]
MADSNQAEKPKAVPRKSYFPNVPESNTDKVDWKPQVIVASDEEALVPITEIPEEYRSIFNGYDTFNLLQSIAFKTVYNSDKSVVVSAPTSSGKTVIFELAIIRLLVNICHPFKKFDSKILYIVPMKAVVHEKFKDWETKFGKFGVKCLEVTGDSELEDYTEIEKASLIFTTPEKWDALTRKDKEVAKVVNAVRLVLIDEVHCINDDARGATLEVVISRMKTISHRRKHQKIRFIAVSATIPNAADIAQWLGSPDAQSVVCVLPSDKRPVQLKNVVLGYYCNETCNDFQFEKKLHYKVSEVIEKYCEGKPSLVFVPTRTSAVDTSKHIARAETVLKCCGMGPHQKQALCHLSQQLDDKTLKALVVRGVAYHHAGLSATDRAAIVAAFSDGRLMVLCCTTTLAMGVNIPAHLVVVKSTFTYMNGVCTDLSETQVLQMIGRAGRPQFDTSAIAVIMTKEKLKNKYEKMLNGTKIIESFLHKHLVEHLNAEIVLGTITDIPVAVDWIRSTFLYIRVLANNTDYGIDASLNKKEVESKLQEWCTKELNGLKKSGMITMNADCCEIRATEIGRVMARYCVSLESMKKFMKLSENENMEQLLHVLSSCEEVTQDIKLRNPDRSMLNAFNETSKEKNKELIRYQVKGKIKTAELKAFVLLQVVLGNMRIDDQALYQDAKRVMKSSQRVSKCLFEYLMINATKFSVLMNSAVLCKSVRAGIWENSVYVTRQLCLYNREIGIALSRDIASGNFTSFDHFEGALPQTLEMFTKKPPPFGKVLLNTIKKLPRYEIDIEQLRENEFNLNSEENYFVNLLIRVKITNMENIDKDFNSKHFCVLLVGNADNEILFKAKIYDRLLIRNKGEHENIIKCFPSEVSYKIMARLVSQEYVGIDVYRDFYATFEAGKVSKYFIHKRKAVERAKYPPVPEELKFLDNWQHICSRDGPCGKHDGKVVLRKTLPTFSVTSVKLHDCTFGPMDKFVNRYPKNVDSATEKEKGPSVVAELDEMMDDPECDFLLSQMQFPDVK